MKDISKPTILPGEYTVKLVDVIFDTESCSINGKIILDGNNKVMSDGKTLVDGVQLDI